MESEASALAKVYTRGTQRTRSPAETVADFGRYRAHFGITRLANITGLDTIGLPVFQAIRPNSRGLATSQGKGLTADAARASALMESIESWHAEHIIAPARFDSFANLSRSAAVLDPRSLPLKPGLRARLDAPSLWLEGLELLGDRPVWVPYELVTTNLVPSPSMTPLYPISSNGLASGNTMLEASCHALYELIERDASALAKVDVAGGLLRRRVDLASVPYPEVLEVVAMFEAAGARHCVFDVTSDLGVPCFECVLGDPRDTAPWNRKGLCSGAGCHLDPGIAMLRAMTEAAQTRVALIAGSRDDIFGDSHEALAETSLAETIAERLFGLPATPLQRYAGATASFEGDLDRLLAALKGAGIEQVAIVELSHPEPRVPVVRAVVPRLEDSPEAAHHQAGARARARARALSERPGVGP